MTGIPPARAAVCVLGSRSPPAERALARSTPSEVPILVEEEALREIAEAGTDDIAVVSGRAVVSEGWLTRLAAAAYSDSTVGSAAALEVVDPAAPEDLALELARHSPRARPRVSPRPASCLYVRRTAIACAGGLDAAVESPAAAVTDLLHRSLLAGMQHVLADDVVVAGAPVTLPDPDLRLLAERYPWAHEEGTTGSPALARSIAALHRAERGLEVTLDLRILGSELSGAQIHVLEVVSALARRGGARLRLLVLDDRLAGEPRRVLESLTGVELLPAAALEGADGLAKTAVAHRPVQVALPDDVDLLRALAERVVVTQQDLIAYRNPAYHAIPDLWRQYRRATRLALAMSDAAVFSSRHALNDALADDLINPERAEVIAVSAEHSVVLAADEARPPRGMRELGPDGYLVSLGNDFRHKNRPFAIRLLGALRERGWRGGLVLAGARMAHGSSADEEKALLRERPELAAAVIRLGPVAEAEKAWLYKNAAAVVYPTTYEGFGLVPFEAGRAGVPCLFAAQAALAEVLPPEAALLVPWDEQASAERALPLLRDSPERDLHVEVLRRGAAGLPSWDEHADALLALYERAAARPEREARVLAVQTVEAEVELAGWNSLRAEVGDEGFGLVSPGGYLPPDVQLALLSIVTRPRLRDPFFAALRAIHRAGRRARGGGQR